MCSSNQGQRPYQPPQNEQERFLVKRVQELYQLAEQRGIARYTAFLSDREQDLARMALGKSTGEYRFWGGYSAAERKVLYIEPEYSYGVDPIVCVRIKVQQPKQDSVPAHKDYLGAILGLGLQRDCIGDIVFDANDTAVVYVPVLEHVQSLLCEELTSVGRYAVHCEPFWEEIPYQEQERTIRTTTVSSLRVDCVLAAMLQCARSQASDLIRSGHVSINHVPTSSVSAEVYQGDLFTVRGKGRFRLQQLGGKSRKDRLFIEYFQY